MNWQARVMPRRRRHRLRPASVGLPAWGWAVAALALMVGLAGLVLSLLDTEAFGAMLMGLSGVSLSACLLLGATTDRERD